MRDIGCVETPRRITGDDGSIRNILGHHTARSDRHVVSDSDTG